MASGPTTLKAKDPQIKGGALVATLNPLYIKTLKTFGIIRNVFGWPSSNTEFDYCENARAFHFHEGLFHPKEVYLLFFSLVDHPPCEFLDDFIH